MAKEPEIGVIGLGKFGFCLAQNLVELGRGVVGIDKSESKVKRVSEFLTQTFQADAADKLALKQLGFPDFSYVIVSIGHSMEASILITLNLKELGARNVWVKAVSEDHAKVLYKIGADLVVIPEQYVALQLAHRLAVPGLLNYLSLGGGIVLQEMTVDKWSGHALRDLDLPRKHNIQVVAVKRQGEQEFCFVPGADTRLERGDQIVVVGREEELGEID